MRCERGEFRARVANVSMFQRVKRCILRFGIAEVQSEDCQSGDFGLGNVGGGESKIRG